MNKSKQSSAATFLDLNYPKIPINYESNEYTSHSVADGIIDKILFNACHESYVKKLLTHIPEYVVDKTLKEV